MKELTSTVVGGKFICIPDMVEFKKMDIYCWMDSGRSQVWMKFLLYRDKTFCHKIAKTFLDSEKILMAEMINLIGENLGVCQTTYRNTKFSKFSMSDKYSIIKTFSAEMSKAVVESAEYENSPGSHFIVPSIHWKILVGQVKVPIRGEDLTEDVFLTLFRFLNSFQTTLNKSDWDVLKYVEDVTASDEFTEMMEKEFVKTVNSFIQEVPYEPRFFQLQSKLRSQMHDAFSGALNVQLVHIGDGTKKSLFNTSGMNIKVQTLVEAIGKNHGSELNRTELKNYSIRWDDGQFGQNAPVCQLIEAHLMKGNEPIFKLGKQFYKVRLCENKSNMGM